MSSAASAARRCRRRYSRSRPLSAIVPVWPSGSGSTNVAGTPASRKLAGRQRRTTRSKKTALPPGAQPCPALAAKRHSRPRFTGCVGRIENDPYFIPGGASHRTRSTTRGPPTRSARDHVTASSPTWSKASLTAPNERGIRVQGEWRNVSKFHPVSGVLRWMLPLVATTQCHPSDGSHR